MCGIVGFTGRQQAAPILLNGLSKLEYRGYDSAGIAVRDGERLAQVVKAKGRLGVFCQVLFPEKSVGIPFFSKGFSLPSAGIMHPCA